MCSSSTTWKQIIRRPFFASFIQIIFQSISPTFLTALGVVHKWRHLNLDIFCHPTPNRHAFYYRGLSTVVTKSLTSSIFASTWAAFKMTLASKVSYLIYSHISRSAYKSNWKNKSKKWSKILNFNSSSNLTKKLKTLK